MKEKILMGAYIRIPPSPVQHVHEQLKQLVDTQGPLPLPGTGETLRRWNALAGVAAIDLSLLKLYEAHHDAAAIVMEVTERSLPMGTTWGVWCSEPPGFRVEARARDDVLTLTGTKAWCSGAESLSHAVVSAWNEAGEPLIAAVELTQPGVQITGDGWHAVGMAAAGSVNVVFRDALALPLGRPHAYIDRPGFWMGACGIAACWWGAAQAIGEHVRLACQDGKPDAHRLAHLGAIDTALTSSSALLHEAAARLDSVPYAAGTAFVDADTHVHAPLAQMHAFALRLRAAVEAACTGVMDHAGRALGATPYCRDAAFARRMADLPVFLRQGHAERDLATLGQVTAACKETPWTL